jgi:hypothetical protein
MSNENAEEAAFPTSEPCAFPKYSPGMTKREYFAAMAMQGILASFAEGFSCSYPRVAATAVDCADALLAALAK